MVVQRTIEALAGTLLGVARAAVIWAAVLAATALAAGIRAQEQTTVAPRGPEASDASRTPAAPIVEAFLERVSLAAGMRARFLQVNRWAVLDEADTARGRMTLAPPQRFRLQYDVPAGHLVGCDGRHVWTFVPEERQVLRADVSAATGWGDFFLRTFYESADSLATVWRTSDGAHVARIALGPRPEWGIRAMEAVLDRDRSVPVSYGYTDEEGNRYRFHFFDPEFPAALADTLFHFAVPPGYELLEVD